MEEGDEERTKTWLGEFHARGELHRSVRLGFITPAEASDLEDKMDKIVKLIEAHKTDEAFRKLVDVQSKAGELAYSAIARSFKEKGLDPPQLIDTRFEPIREKKKAEWLAKGYPLGLIEKAFLWANEWSRGIARRFIREPELAARVAESIYPEALGLSERWMEAMVV